MRWEPNRSAEALPYVPPSLWTAMRRGLGNRCPVCGEGHVFEGFLKIVPECLHCGAPLGRLRADDAPPYFTIFIAGHLVVPLALWLEKAYEPAMWLHMVLWLPLLTILCTLLLRPVKGAVVGWMSALGFLGEEPVPVPDPNPFRGTDG
jgi:uncharacterized protein (DUF983 family)